MPWHEARSVYFTDVSEAILVQKISTLERVSSELQLGMNPGTRSPTQQEHFANEVSACFALDGMIILRWAA